MRNPSTWILVAILISANLSAAAIDWSDVGRERTMESLHFESFNISAAEPISTYGYRLCRFLSDQVYWGAALHSAIFGIRGGWFTGGIIGGYTSSLGTGPLIYDLNVFFGGGGGGGAPQGGGMVGKIDLSAGYRISPSIEALLSTGYNHFFNGNIRSPYVGFEVRNIFYELNH